MRLRSIGILAAMVVALALPLATIFGKVAVKAADARCSDRMPEDSWGYSLEWDSAEFEFLCTYKGGTTNRPVGERESASRISSRRDLSVASGKQAPMTSALLCGNSRRSTPPPPYLAGT